MSREQPPTAPVQRRLAWQSQPPAGPRPTGSRRRFRVRFPGFRCKRWCKRRNRVGVTSFCERQLELRVCVRNAEVEGSTPFRSTSRNPLTFLSAGFFFDETPLWPIIGRLSTANSTHNCHRSDQAANLVPAPILSKSLWIFSPAWRLSWYSLRCLPQVCCPATRASRKRTGIPRWLCAFHSRRGPQRICVGKSFQGCAAPPSCREMAPISV